jgi:hypothetical protein
MSKSFQDLEARLGIVERKLALVMQVASVTKRTPSTLMPGEFIEEQMSLTDLYKEVNAAGVEVNG